MFRTNLFALALASSLMSAGCAVKPLKPTSADRTAVADLAACTRTFAAGSTQAELCEAMNLADGYRRGYLKRAGLISGTREGLGYAFIGASTLALYYGATPQPTRTTAAGTALASPDYAQRVRRMGAIGGGLYAYGQWGSPKARDLVYLDGARAMTCAVLKAAPAIPALTEYDPMKTLLASLRREMRGVEAGLQVANISNRKDAEAALQSARNLVDESEILLAEVDAAGIRLRARVNMIDIEARRRLVDDSPTFESLVSLSSSLPGIARSIAPNMASAASPPDAMATVSHGGGPKPPTPVEIDLSNLLDLMQGVQIKLAAFARVGSAVDSVEGCAVGGAAQFSLVPKATNATIEVGKHYEVLVTDPVGHPSARIAGGQTSSLDLKPIELTGKPNEYKVTVVGKAATESGDKPVLAIRSASGISGTDVSMTVSGSAPQTLQPGQQGQQGQQETDQAACDGDASACAFDASFTADPQQILALQCLIGAGADCRMGPKTRARITRYRLDQKLPPGNFVDSALKTLANPHLLLIQTDPGRFVCPPADGKPHTCPTVPR